MLVMKYVLNTKQKEKIIMFATIFKNSLAVIKFNFIEPVLKRAC
jgi:hypothetical protein